MTTLFLFAILTLGQVNSQRADITWTKDTLDDVEKNIAEKKAVLVDVRSEQEWNKGHIDGAIFLPVTSLRSKGNDPEQLKKKLPKDKILYTYCVVGMRSKTAAYALEQAGYKTRALKPGYDELLKAGFKKAESRSSPAAK